MPRAELLGLLLQTQSASLTKLAALCRLEAEARGVPLRVSTITPTALNTYFFRTRAGRSKTRPSNGAASPDDDSGAAATAEGEGAAGQGQPQGAVLHARDVVQAIFWCLSAPESVDVSDIRLRSLHA